MTSSAPHGAAGRRKAVAITCFLLTTAAVWHAPRALGSVYEVVGHVRSSFVEQKDVAKARVKHPAVLAAILQELQQPHTPEQVLSRLRVDVGGGEVWIRYRTTDPVHGQSVVEALCHEVVSVYRSCLWEERELLLQRRRDLLQAMQAPASAPSPRPLSEAPQERVEEPEALRQQVAVLDARLAQKRDARVVEVEAHPASPWPVRARRLAMASLLGVLGGLCGLAVLEQKTGQPPAHRVGPAASQQNVAAP